MDRSFGLSMTAHSTASSMTVRNPSAIESLRSRRWFLSLQSLPAIWKWRSSSMAEAWSTRNLLTMTLRLPWGASSMASIACCREDTLTVGICAISARSALFLRRRRRCSRRRRSAAPGRRRRRRGSRSAARGARAAAWWFSKLDGGLGERRLGIGEGGG